MKKEEIESTPSTWMSQVDGLTAGVLAGMSEMKKRICCQPTVQEQEHVAMVVARLLPDVLVALEAAILRVPEPSA